MKRYFTLIIALLASTSFSYSMSTVSTESKKVSFIQSERKEIDYGDFERSNKRPLIEAYYDNTNNSIELELCNVGIASIYIIDTTGAVLDQTTIETDVYATVTLSTAFCKGNFYVIVDSDYIYAEGFVSL